MEKSVMSFALMLISLVAIAGLITFSVQQGMPQNDIQDIDLKQFASQEEFDAFLNDTGIQASRSFMFGGGEMVTMAESLDSSAGDGAAAPQKTSADDYSTTNIQVEGVDEADIVKNDGKYIYVATGTKVVILDAYPADDMKVLAEINFTNNNEKVKIYYGSSKLNFFQKNSSLRRFLV